MTTLIEPKIWDPNRFDSEEEAQEWLEKNKDKVDVYKDKVLESNTKGTKRWVVMTRKKGD